MDGGRLIPVNQGETDECLAACLASILELPLSIVPRFSRPRTWETQQLAAQRWLSEHYGLTIIEVSARRSRSGRYAWAPLAGPVLCIGGLDLGRKTYHAVVAEVTSTTFDIVHDPAGHGRTGRILSAGFLIPLRPDGKKR